MEEELMLCAAHYDALILENNDPVRDPPPLQAYMAQWDGAAFLALLQLTGRESVLEIGVGTGRLAQKTAPLCNLFAGIDLSRRPSHAQKKIFARSTACSSSVVIF